jgi:hypothetical protein
MSSSPIKWAFNLNLLGKMLEERLEVSKYYSNTTIMFAFPTHLTVTTFFLYLLN